MPILVTSQQESILCDVSQRGHFQCSMVECMQSRHCVGHIIAENSAVGVLLAQPRSWQLETTVFLLFTTTMISFGIGDDPCT